MTIRLIGSRKIAVILRMTVPPDVKPEQLMPTLITNISLGLPIAAWHDGQITVADESSQRDGVRIQ